MVCNWVIHSRSKFIASDMIADVARVARLELLILGWTHWWKNWLLNVRMSLGEDFSWPFPTKKRVQNYTSVLPFSSFRKLAWLTTLATECMYTCNRRPGLMALVRSSGDLCCIKPQSSHRYITYQHCTKQKTKHWISILQPRHGEDVEAMELAAALAPVTRCAWPVYTAAINQKFLQVVVLVVIGALAVMVVVGVIGIWKCLAPLI